MAPSASLQGSCSAGIEEMGQWEFGLVDDYVDMNRSRRCLHAAVVMIRYHRSMSCYPASGGTGSLPSVPATIRAATRLRNILGL